MENLSIEDAIEIGAIICIPNKEELIRILRLLSLYRGVDFNNSDIQSEVDSLWRIFDGVIVYDALDDCFREPSLKDACFELTPSLAVVL